ncbi:MAG TPA: HlyD family efflux transporter periplasmic adaptor subunit [Candidatus Saccharimonadia bacterium]|nr:HlyD family efflux transporter periplasmic adaptor subunit [Candidatus Saccharimonadia bacterium]
MKTPISARLIATKDRFLKLPNWAKLLLIVVIGAAVWFGVRKLQTTANSAPQYQTAQVQRGTLVVSITASGSVSAANSGSISTNASGVVSKIYVKNGDVVKGGAPIAAMELDEDGKQKYSQASAAYQGAKNALANAQNQLYTLQAQMFTANQTFVHGAATEGLSSGDPIFIEQNATWLASEQSYINQQNVIAQAQTSLNSAAATLRQSSPTVYAPISGTVTGLSLQVGSVLTAQSSSTGTATSQKIASIQTSAPPTVTVTLTEIDVPKVKIGDRATVTFDALPDKTYTGKIVSVDTIGSVSSGVTSYPIVIGLDIADPDIYSNMNAQTSIITDTRDDVLIVPLAAVTTTNGQSTVRIMKNGQVSMMNVEVGISSDTQTEIKSGLSEGDTVVTGVTSPTTTRTTIGTTSVFSAIGGGRGFGGGGGTAVRVGTTGSRGN